MLLEQEKNLQCHGLVMENIALFDEILIIRWFFRHSLSVASDFVNHEKLLHLICDNFLPLKSAHMTNSSGLLYDQPVHYALKFLRLLMMWGRNITKKILDPEFYDLGPRILCYLSIEPDMQSNTLQESLRLIVEAGRTWITCLRYGLGKKYQWSLALFYDFIGILLWTGFFSQTFFELKIN